VLLEEAGESQVNPGRSNGWCTVSGYREMYPHLVLGLGFGSRVSAVDIRSVRRLLVTASVVPSSPILVTLMKEALSSSETSVLTRASRRNIPEDGILHSHSSENLKSYIALTGWTL
jgi:hypothetical protein